jgi:LytR cell envelope-related transcriptional attenuator
MRSGSGPSTGGTRQVPVPARDAAGTAATSLLTVVSLVAVLAALIVFLTTGDHPVEADGSGSGAPADTSSTPPPSTDPVQSDPVQTDPVQTGPVQSAPAQTHPTRPPPTVQPQQPAHHDSVGHPTKPPRHHTQAQPAAQHRNAYVEVYNNSAIKGLAARAAAALQDVGWEVVGTDNWYGTIPSNTVYYPAKLKSQANLLAKDLGISRTHPAVSPMRFDRLTVILTGHL